MIVTFTGPQSSGKTTLLNKCKELYGSTHRIVDEITRKVHEKGHVINENAGNITQLLILNSHIENAILPGDAILDRCIIDGYLYINYLYKQGKVDHYCVQYAWNLHNELISRYDVFFYTNPYDVPLVDDGVRSSSKKFRDGIIAEFESYMATQDVSKFVVLKGSVEERMATIISRLGPPTTVLTVADQVVEHITKHPIVSVAGGMQVLEHARRFWDTSYGSVFTDDNSITFVTGGWSENEAIVTALLNNPAVASLLWLKSERGGKYAFKYEQPR